ncbi:MAG: hypothetical protein ACD_34C00253G0001 [uncultured bacterium]|nr:MAG: hypothetical protein ACD_34C00253G0001 [uncultured bacterium]
MIAAAPSIKKILPNKGTRSKATGNGQYNVYMALNKPKNPAAQQVITPMICNQKFAITNFGCLTGFLIRKGTRK